MPDEILNPVDAGAENVVDSQQVEQAEVQSESSESVNEEVTPSQIEKPVQSKEDNAQYASIRREAEAKAEARTRDKMISEMYGQSHNIHTYADYQKAVEKEAEQQRRASLEDKGIDPSVFDEYINNNPTVKRSKEIIAQQEAQQKQAKEYGEFLEYFKNATGKEFNPSTDKIPDEVWTQNAKGKSLVDAYAMSETKTLRAKIAEYEAKEKAIETNTKNAASSPGSLTGNGNTSSQHFTADQVRSMTPAQVKQNFSAIEESMKKW